MFKSALTKRTKNGQMRMGSALACSPALWGMLLTGYAGVPAVQAEEKASALEEIMVTARRKEEGLLEAPISVTAFTTDMLERRQVVSLDQIASATPNLILDAGAALSGSSAAATVYIRGLGQTDFSLAVDPGVGLYLDGVFIGRSVGGVLKMVDVESVEVLRGPQGTLFGRNTIGGAVNITSTKPHDKFAGGAEVTVGSRNRVNTRAHLNAPASETLFTKFSFLSTHQDGFVERPFLDGKTGDDRSISGRGAMRWQPTDKLTIDLSVDYTWQDENGAPATLVYINPTAAFVNFHNLRIADNDDPNSPTGPFDERALPNGFEDKSILEFDNQLELWGTSLTMQWDLDIFTVKSITSYRDVESKNGRQANKTPQIISGTDQILNQDQFSQELQFLGNALDDRLDWIFGLYYYEEHGISINRVVFAPIDFVSGGAIANKSTAAFLQATYDITERLALTLGGRITEDKRALIIDDRVQFVIRDDRPPAARGDLPPNGRRDFSMTEFTPRADLSYRWDEDFMTYVSYSEGFKSGGFTQRILPGTLDEFPSFEPEFVKAYEAGFKWRGFDGRLQVTGAAFYTDYTNLQIQINRGVAPVTENGGKAEVKGFELEVAALVTERLLINAGIGYLDGKYKEVDPAAVEITLDSKLPKSPKWQLNASASYEQPIFDAGTMRFNVDWSYRSTVYNDAINSPWITQDGFHQVNASVSFMDRPEQWQLALQGRNLFNKQYIVTGIGNAPNQGNYEAIWSQPRELSVRLKYNF